MAVLECTMMSKAGENSKNFPKNAKNKQKKVLLVAQEIRLARKLAGNDRNVRARTLRSLRKWFQHRCKTLAFDENDFLRLWKGLFYSMWMSDQMLVQEECAENIAGLLHCLDADTAMVFLKCGLRILMNEWNGIDHYRLNKFKMFVRRLLRQALLVLKGGKWKTVGPFVEALAETALNPGQDIAIGLLMHISDIYLEEVAKVCEGRLKASTLTQLLMPFIKCLTGSTDTRITQSIRNGVFIHLLKQSEVGIKYAEKYEAWKSLGFPGSIDMMQKIDEVENDEETEAVGDGESEEGKKVSKKGGGAKALDPRAGKVDVELPQLKFDAKAIVAALTEHKFNKGGNMKTRKTITDIILRYEKFSKGVYPLAGKKKMLEPPTGDLSIRKAANRLVSFDKKSDRKRKNSDDILDSDNNEDRSSSHRRKRSKMDEGVLVGYNEMSLPVLSLGHKRKQEGEGEMEEGEEEDTLPHHHHHHHLPHNRRIVIKKKARGGTIDGPVEMIFKRNSGTWFVTPIAATSPPPPSSPPSRGTTVTPNKKKSPQHEDTHSSKKTSPSYVELFPRSEWDEPLKEGEYEICVPNRRKVSAKQSNNTSPSGTVGAALATLRSSKGLSLDPELVRNPFGFRAGDASSSSSTPAKRVKINTSLNTAQDVSEHHAQILSSPAIPYDANKMPSRPLLKTSSAANSPINPFYKQLDI